jgi:hypothetical protein
MMATRPESSALTTRHQTFTFIEESKHTTHTEKARRRQVALLKKVAPTTSSGSLTTIARVGRRRPTRPKCSRCGSSCGPKGSCRCIPAARQSSSPNVILGSGIKDPFDSYPIPLTESYMFEYLDHCKFFIECINFIMSRS